MTAPLDGLRVLDLTTGAAGPYATKLLADHGAEVIKVEPPGGDESRLAGPFPRGEADPESSARFLFLNTNKRSIVLDLADDADRRIVEGLAAQCDAVIEDRLPGELDALGLGYERLQALRPGLVLASITPWGQSGPYVDAGLRLTDIVAQAMGGPMLWTGSAEREPLRLGGGGALALYQAGGVTALAVGMALVRQEQTGLGDHIDVSIYETQIGSRDRAAPYLANHIYNGIEPKRRASGGTLASGMRPCMDGYVNIAGTGVRLPRFLEMIGRGDLAGDPAIAEGARDPDLAGEIEAAYMLWLSERGKREAAETAQQHRLLAGPVNSIADLPEEAHFRDRGAWETVDHPHTGPLEYPGRPFIMNASPRPPARRAPRGRHPASARAAERQRATPAARGRAHRRHHRRLGRAIRHAAACRMGRGGDPRRADHPGAAIDPWRGPQDQPRAGAGARPPRHLRRRVVPGLRAGRGPVEPQLRVQQPRAQQALGGLRHHGPGGP
jgi:crotonobetainyl-CoA:carnitine CoA-transferase CaiB-like acyl-CoA transferase